MALHNIKVIVVDGGRNGTYKSKNAGLSTEDKKKIKETPLYKTLHLKETIKNKVQSGMTPSGVLAFDLGVQLAKQVARQTLNFYISDIGRRNGDSNYQQVINRQIEIITDATDLLNGVLSGAATGSMFGPVGAAVGAAAGIASSAISIGFRQAERERTYQHQVFKENTSQAYNLARANYSVYTGRVR